MKTESGKSPFEMYPRLGLGLRVRMTAAVHEIHSAPPVFKTITLILTKVLNTKLFCNRLLLNNARVMCKSCSPSFSRECDLDLWAWSLSVNEVEMKSSSWLSSHSLQRCCRWVQNIAFCSLQATQIVPALFLCVCNQIYHQESFLLRTFLSFERIWTHNAWTEVERCADSVGPDAAVLSAEQSGAGLSRSALVFSVFVPGDEMDPRNASLR